VHISGNLPQEKENTKDRKDLSYNKLTTTTHSKCGVGAVTSGLIRA